MDNSIIGITQSSLLSEATRQIIGQRNIDLYQTYRQDSRGLSRRGRLGGFFNMLGAGMLDYVLSNFTSIVMGSLLTLYMFDWASTDEELKKQMEANELAMITAGGRLIADGIVQMAGVGIVKQAKHRYPRISPTALAELEEENREETIAGIRSFLIATRSNLMSNIMLQTFMSGRQMLGMTPTTKKEPWIAADQVQKIYEEQKNPQLKALLTGVIDQLEDRFFDLAYLVCNTVTASYEMNRLAAKSSQGPSRLVQLTPDKSNPEVKTLIYGNQQDVMTQITAVTTQNAIVDNKDIGQIVQVGLDKAMKAERNERVVTAYFYSGINGATTLPDGQRAQKKEMRIPRLKLSVDWEKLKTTLTPFDGGNYKVICHLNDGHQLAGNFATEAEGRSYLTNIVNTLCEGEIVKFSTIKPSSNPKFRSTPARFTVATATMRIAKKTTDETKKTMVDANAEWWKVKSIRLKLRLAEKPDGIDAQILNPWGDA